MDLQPWARSSVGVASLSRRGGDCYRLPAVGGVAAWLPLLCRGRPLVTGGAGDGVGTWERGRRGSATVGGFIEAGR